MKNTQKGLLAGAMTLTMLTGVGTSAVATEYSAVPASATGSSFTDMPAPGRWSYAALRAAADNGLMQGDNGLIRPADPITRAEAAAILNRAFGAQQKSSATFTDTSAAAWYYNDVAIAVYMKTFTGMSDTTFAPTQNITREQAFTILARALKLQDGTAADLSSFTDATQVSSWAAPSVAAMVKAGYVNGNSGKLNPTANISREEFAQILYKGVDTYITKAGTYTSVPEQGNVLIRTNDVILKDVTIAGDLIIGDGVGNGDVTLENVTVTGRFVVRGGGVDTIKLVGGSYKNVVIAKVDGSVRIYADGAEVQTVKVADGQPNNNVVLDGVFDNVIVQGENIAVTIGGSETTTVNNISMTATGATLVVGKNATVTSVAVSADKAAMDVEGTVKTASISGNGVTVAAKDGGKVETVRTSGVNTTIGGGGTVSNVVAENGSSGVVVNTSGTKVTNSSSADVKVGDSVVSPSTSSTGGSSGGGGGSGTVTNNYGAINAPDGSYNFTVYSTINSDGVGSVTFDKDTGVMTAVAKKSISGLSGDVKTTVAVRDLLGLSTDAETSRSISSFSSISNQLSGWLDDVTLNKVTLKFGDTTAIYTISRTNYDDGVVKFTATPNDVAAAKTIGSALVDSIDRITAVSRGLQSEAAFNSNGSATFAAGDTFSLAGEGVKLTDTITVTISGASQSGLNAILDFLKDPTSGNLVSAAGALADIAAGTTELTINLDTIV